MFMQIQADSNTVRQAKQRAMMVAAELEKKKVSDTRKFEELAMEQYSAEVKRQQELAETQPTKPRSLIRSHKKNGNGCTRFTNTAVAGSMLVRTPSCDSLNNLKASKKIAAVNSENASEQARLQNPSKQ